MGKRIVVMLVWLGCGDNNTGSHPPAAPIDPTIPADVEAALEHDDQGRPIVIDTPSMVAEGERVALVFDKDLDDPITRYGWCLERVAACRHANPTSPLSGCIDQIQPCADNTGGRACCAPACVAEYHQQQALGLDDKEAIAASFVRGDCLQGFTALAGAQ
jgi:hypothetical protein